MVACGVEAIVLERCVTEVVPESVAAVPPYARWSRNCLLTLYGLFAMWGGIQVAFPDSDAMYALFALMAALAATFWARLDALARSRPIAPILQMLYFLLWPVGALVYLIARSGWRGLGQGLMHAVGLLVTIVVACNLTIQALHVAGLLDPRFYQQP
jgi:hypothetical protein